ncbi:uncharacterized protein LOC110369382 [Fundulus heteroclitus]|uniref:uncharacterized protein LOC110369382 n=1 Tax=Fundulus heteroclitus TaxID=8078 RepID=UPI00165AFBD7|nr:uncharacterized protein LOC110369382 [Fundulus heteroclitus]
MGTERAKNPAVCLAAAVILTVSLVQTTDCLRLRKTLRGVTPREPDPAFPAGIREGHIVFGKVLELSDENRKKPRNVSADDETDYQSDFPGWSHHTDMDEASKEKWNRFGTSLQCFDDHMRFRFLGPGASQLSVEQANEPPMPLSMVPPRCGYRMHGNPMAFVMMAPYDGCNVIQQGGNYVLPLLWQGHPLSLLCPKRGRTTVPQRPQIPQGPQVLHGLSHPYFNFYSRLSHAPAEPAKSVPQFPKFPLYPYLYPPETTSAPAATVVPKVSYPQIPVAPYFPFPYWPQFPDVPPFHYPNDKYPMYPTSGPKTTTTTTTRTTATTMEIPYTTTASPATTQGPSNTPAQVYPMDYLPFVPNEHFPHLFYSQG